MSLKNKAAKGVVWSVIQRWGRTAFSTIIFIILARQLPPEAFGLVAMATIFTAFIEIFLDQGLSAAIVQRQDITEDHLDTAFWASIITGVIMTIAGIALSGLVASLFDEPQLAPIIIWLSFSFVIIALSSTQVAILRRKLAFRDLATRSLIAMFVGGIVGVAMAFSGFGVWSLVGQNLADGLAAAVVLWRSSDWRPKLNFSTKHFKDLFSFGISIVGNKILVFFNRRSDDFLIGYFLGPTLLGYYTIGYRILLILIRLVTKIINAVAFPTFSRIQHNPKRMRNAYYKATQYTNLLAIPAFIGMAILAPELINTLFGEKWAPSVPVMQVLALIGILNALIFFNGTVIQASGKPDWNLGIMFLTAVVSVLGFLIAVRWGIVAVAVSFVIAGYLVAPISYFALRKLINVNFKTYVLQFIAPLSATLVMVAVIMGLKYLLKDQNLNQYFEIAIYISAGVITYTVTIGLMARQLSRQVVELLFEVIPNNRIRIIFSPLEKYFLK
ncbi:MAG: MOP flippase family protein [Chloroflexota bacterium]|nr:MAG: MOP flippase family protein [Chloroflexota bacterium]